MSEQSVTTVRVEVKLLDEIREQFPENQKLKNSVLVDVSLRKLLEMNKK